MQFLLTYVILLLLSIKLHCYQIVTYNLVPYLIQLLRIFHTYLSLPTYDDTALGQRWVLYSTTLLMDICKYVGGQRL